jgi:Ca2+-binding RTX toxin-like protein
VGGGHSFVETSASSTNIRTGSGSDWVTAGSGSDWVTAGSGSDWVTAGSGSDWALHQRIMIGPFSLASEHQAKRTRSLPLPVLIALRQVFDQPPMKLIDRDGVTNSGSLM